MAHNPALGGRFRCGGCTGTAWWGLFAIAGASAVLGLVDLASGVTYQAVDATGTTLADIAAQSDAGARLSDFSVRTDGIHLIELGVLMGAVLLFAFRQGRPWAWWTMWTLPISVIAASVLDLRFGVAGPAISGTIVGLVAVAIMLITAPRFFKQQGHP